MKRSFRKRKGYVVHVFQEPLVPLTQILYNVPFSILLFGNDVLEIHKWSIESRRIHTFWKK